MAKFVTTGTAELFCRAAKRALEAAAASGLNAVMRNRTKLDLDDDLASRLPRAPVPARDIVAALLLTLAAAILIGVAATSRPVIPAAPDAPRVEAAAGQR